MVEACPHCDSSQTYYRRRTSDYRCNGCGDAFEEPVERPPRHGAPDPEPGPPDWDDADERVKELRDVYESVT